jgi:hypothetical protein
MARRNAVTPRVRRVANGREGPASLSQPEQLLISFHRLSQGTTARVPYEELVIQAWKDFPESFSLRNHPEYPDASDIHKKLYQTLKASGYIVSLGNKMFRLTDKGVARAEELTRILEGRPSGDSDAKGRLSRAEEIYVQRALASRAFLTWQSGNREDLVDYDARIFFQFSTGTSMHERIMKVRSAREAISKACQLGIKGASDLEALADFLSDRFSNLFSDGVNV